MKRTPKFSQPSLFPTECGRIKNSDCRIFTFSLRAISGSGFSPLAPALQELFQVLAKRPNPELSLCRLRMSLSIGETNARLSVPLALVPALGAMIERKLFDVPGIMGRQTSGSLDESFMSFAYYEAGAAWVAHSFSSRQSPTAQTSLDSIVQLDLGI